MAKILVVGSLNMDLVALTPRIPIPGETIIGTRYFTAPGGKGANQAYAASRLGGDVAMLGRVGDDDFGRQMRNNLANSGCDVALVQTSRAGSGVALICVGASGENSIIVVPGANGELLPSAIDEQCQAFDDAKFVLLQLESPLETVIAAARTAKERGALVILDPAPAPLQKLPRELLDCVDMITPNETEATILAGQAPSSLKGSAVPALQQKLQSLGFRTVVLKAGEQGCFVRDGESTTHIAAPKVVVADTTAAGDVFNGALAVGLSEGADLIEACRFAVHASALSVTRLGAQSSAPSRDELRDGGYDPPSN